MNTLSDEEFEQIYGRKPVRRVKKKKIYWNRIIIALIILIGIVTGLVKLTALVVSKIKAPVKNLSILIIPHAQHYFKTVCYHIVRISLLLTILHITSLLIYAICTIKKGQAKTDTQPLFSPLSSYFIPPMFSRHNIRKQALCRRL